MAQSVQTRLIGIPLDDPPAWAFPLVTAIGFAALHFGRLEQQIDILLISINKEHHSTEKYRPTPNTSFRRKCELFQRWFVDDARFAKFHDRASRLAKSFKIANDDRTLLFHSNVQEFIQGPPLMMIAKNIKIEGDQVRISRAEWTEESIRGFAMSVGGLNRGLYTISHEALRTDFLETLQTTSSPAQTETPPQN